jgi:hypothetical protein
MKRTLDEAVDLLTREGRSWLRDGKRGRRLVITAPLLVQLRMEITSSSGGSGGPSSTTAAIPLAAAALDLLEEIKGTVHEEWWLAHGHHHGHGRGTLVGELRAWASVAHLAADGGSRASGLCNGWADAIEALLQPVRRWEIVGACPKCRATRTVASLDVGETVYAPALCLEFLADGTRGYCRACGESFEPEVLAALIKGA